MSRFDNIHVLDKQLADLHMNMEPNASGKIKKIPPVVPPKKKSQFPLSAAVNNCPEPVGHGYPEPPYLSKSPAMNYSRLSYPDTCSIQPSSNDYVNLNFSSSGLYSGNNLSKPFESYSSAVCYNNMEENHPPISPPLPHHISSASDQTFHKEEYLPPPSPVSSNYSELIRATTNINLNQQKSDYPPIYQNETVNGVAHPSTYESLYEPIEHPSNFSTLNSSHYSNSLQSSRKQLPKEAEVDALTDLLVKSISNSQDLDFFGICVKCNEKVVGENSGCTAMGNMYHIKCFCCYQCNINLHGKRLYAVEGEPYCETDYYETLEKCTVCSKPIVDRILRATGNPYHRECFTCVVCNESLDGVPFTVDAMNQIHCIEDFHKKFAPRCCVCELPIMPEEGEEETVRVVALDRSFHIRCYRCEDCGLLLSSEEEGRGCYPLDDHILCKNCNAYRIRQLTNVITTDL